MAQTREQKRASATPAPQHKPQLPRGEEAANQLPSLSGNELPAKVRQPLESQFDADFSNVRVHSDRRASEAAQALGARAFTIGRHIAFREGEYDPASSAGKRLLAHELTHVEQQRDASAGRAAVERDPGQEREANAAADRALLGRAVNVSAVSRGGSLRIQPDDDKAQKKGDAKPAAPQAAGVTLTFVLRAPDDAYTQDVTDYVSKTLNEAVIPVDNIEEAAEYVAKYAKDNKTKINNVRLIGHGSTTGGIKMTPKGQTQRRFVTAQELTDMAADQKITAKAQGAMADGATVEFYGCYVGKSEATGKAVGTIFGDADFKAIDSTLRTNYRSFARPAEKGDPGYAAKGQTPPVEVTSTREIDERVAKGNKKLGQSFNQWLLATGKQLEADGDLAPQKDDAARIAAVREVFDRSGGRIKRLEINSGQDNVHRGDKKQWLNKWKTVKAK